MKKIMKISIPFCPLQSCLKILVAVRENIFKTSSEQNSTWIQFAAQHEPTLP